MLRFNICVVAVAYRGLLLFGIGLVAVAYRGFLLFGIGLVAGYATPPGGMVPPGYTMPPGGMVPPGYATPPGELGFPQQQIAHAYTDPNPFSVGPPYAAAICNGAV